MPDIELEPTDPEPMQVEHGALMTLEEARILLGRPSIRVLERWVATGLLKSRYKQATWPYAQLVTSHDLLAVANRRRTGKRKSTLPLQTISGKSFVRKEVTDTAK